MAQVLLLEDVDSIGRSGEVVNVKPGFARNYLYPQGLAVIADKHTLRMQQKLKEEREKQAIVDRQESEELANRINGISITKVVKVDQEGHMYGSVTAHDILHLLQDELRVELEKKSVVLKHPIKATGVHTILVKLKEGVTANFNLKVMSEEGYRNASEEIEASA